MNQMGRSMVWMIIVSVVINLNLSIIFLFSVSIPLSMAIFIGIFFYMIKQTILSRRDMGNDNIGNEMLLGSGIDYLRISGDYESKSKANRSITSTMRREQV
jgi:hypothetical protein